MSSYSDTVQVALTLLEILHHMRKFFIQNKYQVPK